MDGKCRNRPMLCFDYVMPKLCLIRSRWSYVWLRHAEVMFDYVMPKLCLVTSRRSYVCLRHAEALFDYVTPKLCLITSRRNFVWLRHAETLFDYVTLKLCLITSRRSYVWLRHAEVMFDYVTLKLCLITSHQVAGTGSLRNMTDNGVLLITGTLADFGVDTFRRYRNRIISRRNLWSMQAIIVGIQIFEVK